MTLNTPFKGDKMEMDTFRGVLILHFLSMITPQYHHIFSYYGTRLVFPVLLQQNLIQPAYRIEA